MDVRKTSSSGDFHHRLPDHADRNLAVIHHWALSLLKQEQTAKISIKAKRKKAGWDFDYLLKVLSL